LNITDSVFENITSPLIMVSDVTTLINNVAFNQISCSKSSISFCLFKATSSDSIKIFNSSITNINSNVDLISFSSCPKVFLSKISAYNIFKLTQESLEQIFTINAFKVQSLNISQSDFRSIGISGVKVKDNSIIIQDSNFSNRLKNNRLLFESVDMDDSLYSAKISQPIQFIVLETSNSTLNSVSFIENSFNNLIDGGAIQILGLGGVHKITDCTFENNQALNGGALYVKGKANSLNIVNSQFSNNKASENGGALFFPDQSVKDSFLISQATFLQNSAVLGGGIYLGNQALIVNSSFFIENNALQGGAIATLTSSNPWIWIINDPVK